jgi:hypothetical protein
MGSPDPLLIEWTDRRKGGRREGRKEGRYKISN